MSRRFLTTVILSSSLVGAACGGSSSATPPPELGYAVLESARISPGDAVPAPSGDVVLSLDGAISNVNNGERLDFDLETLESLGTVTYSVDDPQAEGRVVEFSGVLLETVLAVAQPAGGAQTLVAAALNDYSIEIPLADASESPVLIATRADGRTMPVDRFGPIRIVYPYDSHDLDPVEHDPRWVWQLASIRVR